MDRPASNLKQGTIYSITASVELPFYYLIRETSSGPSRTSARLSFLDAHPEAGKIRPCLIWGSQDAEDLICLLATFGGEDIQNLPQLVQHFLIPVHPTTRPGSFQLRTTPQWRLSGGKNQWIIAHPFPSPSHSDPTCHGDNANDPGYMVEALDLSRFRRECRRLNDEFHSYDEKTRAAMIDEFLVWILIFPSFLGSINIILGVLFASPKHSTKHAQGICDFANFAPNWEDDHWDIQNQRIRGAFYTKETWSYHLREGRDAEQLESIFRFIHNRRLKDQFE
jgi:hypothetical protein